MDDFGFSAFAHDDRCARTGDGPSLLDDGFDDPSWYLTD
ncbi:MAG: hypothetical protein JWR33_464 [Naasia sp.]|jgi:hypothetical protein|nr:hypothetical protein [Naasia sp.]